MNVTIKCATCRTAYSLDIYNDRVLTLRRLSKRCCMHADELDDDHSDVLNNIDVRYCWKSFDYLTF